MLGRTKQLIWLIWQKSLCMVAFKSKGIKVGSPLRREGWEYNVVFPYILSPKKVMSSRQMSKVILPWVTLWNTGHRRSLCVDVWCSIWCLSVCIWHQTEEQWHCPASTWITTQPWHFRVFKMSSLAVWSNLEMANFAWALLRPRAS